MPNHRIQFEFEATPFVSGGTGLTVNPATAGAKAGWTEAWYDTANLDTPVAALNAAQISRIRRGMLTPGWSLTALRVSPLDANLNLQRKGVHTFLSPANAIGLFPTANQDEQPYDAIVCACATAGNNPHSRDFRGIPQEIINAGGRYTGLGAWPGSLSLFVDAITGIALPGPLAPPVTRWGFRIRTLSSMAGISLVATSPQAWAPFAAPNAPAFQTPLDPGLPVPQGRVTIIRNAVGMRGLNGTWKVMSATGPLGTGGFVVQLQPKRRANVVGVYNGGGVYMFVTYTLDPLTLITPGYGSSRRTGRPSRLPRGRQSARVS